LKCAEARAKTFSPKECYPTVYASGALLTQMSLMLRLIRQFSSARAFHSHNRGLSPAPIRSMFAIRTAGLTNPSAPVRTVKQVEKVRKKQST